MTGRCSAGYTSCACVATNAAGETFWASSATCGAICIPHLVLHQPTEVGYCCHCCMAAWFTVLVRPLFAALWPQLLAPCAGEICGSRHTEAWRVRASSFWVLVLALGLVDLLVVRRVMIPAAHLHLQTTDGQ